jgi:large subunit ribosomal protein L25
MEQFVINASTRKETGKKYAKKIRAKGKIPAVAYNESGEAFSLEVDVGEFSRAWRSITKTTLVLLKIDGVEHKAFIKDTEYDIKTDSSLHADFYIVSGEKKITSTYRIRYSGTPSGVLRGGFMVKHVPEVKIKALPQDLPEFITADVSSLDIGGKFTIADLKLNDKVEVLSNPSSLVVSIAPPRK